MRRSSRLWPWQASQRLLLTVAHPRLPHARNCVVNLEWGDPRAFGTAAYWAGQYFLAFGDEPQEKITQGRDLIEETIACMLAGHVRAEVALAAFRALSEADLIGKGCSVGAIEEVLTRPMYVAEKPVKYPFAAQRAGRIAGAIEILTSGMDIPTETRALRSALLRLPGIGPKTASWIVRNVTSSEEVAVIDVHVYRAGVTAGFFLPAWDLPRDYFTLEEAFLAFSKAAGVSPSHLDLLIWDQMRRRYRMASSLLDGPCGFSVVDIFGPDRGDALPIATCQPI